MLDVDVVTRLRRENLSYELACEAANVIVSLRAEIRMQQREIAQLINSQNVLLDFAKPPEYSAELP